MKLPLALVLSVVVAVGAIAANQLGAQTTAPPVTSAGVPTVQNIVEITRAVPAGTAAVDVFTVPAGVTLVVTDVIVTNTGTAAACGGAVNRGGAAVATSTTATAGVPATTSTTPTLTPPPAITPTGPTTTPGAAGTPVPTASAAVPAMTTASAGTLTQTDSTVTGPLCVPAQTTTVLPLTTGIEFASGQILQLLNAPVAAPPTAAGVPGSLAFHLRGLLITLG
jgi:hypothetical protein